MPNTETFTNSYVVTPGSNANEYTIIVTNAPGTFTLSDTQDGTSDGSTDIGSNFSNSGATTSNGKFLGLVSGANPVFLNLDTTQILMYSNTAGLVGTFTADGVHPYLYCYGKGTSIATPDGETTVETLEIGDTILNQDGAEIPVKWIGRQTLHKRTAGHRMQPVRIKAGALGGGLPHSDLTVTADHGMVLEGMVINASALVNGDTIDFVPMADLDDSFTVYHVETEAHDVILANGAASETFIDAAGRRAFDNHQEYLDLYGVERVIPELQLPRITTARLVPSHISQKAKVAA